MPLANAVQMMLKAKEELERRSAAAGRPVFISYSHKDASLAAGLSATLARHRFPVWKDTRLKAGDHYPAILEQALGDAFAVVAIVSHHSARSDWVLWETQIARSAGKLVTAIVPGIDPSSLRPPFNALHMVPLGDDVAVLAAVRRLARRATSRPQR